MSFVHICVYDCVCLYVIFVLFYFLFFVDFVTCHSDVILKFY